MIKKSKEKIFYDQKSDALWLLIKSGEEYEHREISPGVSVELGKDGELLGIEILNASKIFAKKIRKGKGDKVINYQPASS